MPLVKVLIVEDNELFRPRMCAWLESTEDIIIVGAAKDPLEAIDLIHEAQPDTLLLDVDSLGTSHLPAVLRQVLSQSPDIKIIVLHEDGQEDLVLEAFKEGATGHLIKRTLQPDEVIEAIQAVNRGDVILSSQLAGTMLDKVIRKWLQESPALHRG